MSGDRDLSVGSPNDIDPDAYLIWSNEHRAWWRPNRRGYTVHIDRAGRYSRAEAIKESRTRDQRPDEPPPELPVREEDALACRQREGTP